MLANLVFVAGLLTPAAISTMNPGGALGAAGAEPVRGEPAASQAPCDQGLTPWLGGTLQIDERARDESQAAAACSVV